MFLLKPEVSRGVLSVTMRRVDVSCQKRSIVNIGMIHWLTMELLMILRVTKLDGL